MRWQSLIPAAAVALLLGGVAVRGAEPEPDSAHVSPLYGVAIPEAYRSWELIAPATEDAPFDELRVILANPIAAEAFRSGVRPFPDGSKLIKLAWKRRRSPDFASATIPGEATTIQVMVKDSRRYGASGG